MKILHCFKYYHPSSGGIEHAVKTTAEELTRRGEAVKVCASVNKGRGKHFEHNDVEVIKSGSLGSVLSVPLSPAFPLRFNHLQRWADIVHFHLPDPLSTTAALLSQPDDVSTIVTYHSDIVRQSRALAVYHPVRDRLLDRADKILVTSPQLLKNATALDSYQDKCEIVPLGINIERYDSCGSTNIRMPGDKNRPTLLFTGRLVYYKGLKYLLEAMVGINADVWIAGKGPLRESLVQRASELGISDRIHLLGYVSEERLHYCYENADIFVFPSTARSEAFGVAQLEAMAYHLPVINTNLPTGVPWVSRDGETGLTVQPGDSTELRRAIKTLIQDPELAERLGAAARKRVEKQFTVEQFIERTHNVYKSVTFK
jgi:rhamnosyl/mannosyltransferase